MAILKMIFLFQRRDTLVCWRVTPSTWPCTWWNNSKFTTGFRGPYLFDAFCVWIGFLLCPAIWCEKRPSHLWNHFVKLQLNWNLSRVCRKSLGPACNGVDTGRGVQITHLFVHFTIASGNVPRRTVLSPKVDITIHQPTNQPTNQPTIAIDIWRHLKPGKQKPYLGNSGHRLKDLTTHTHTHKEKWNLPFDAAIIFWNQNSEDMSFQTSVETLGGSVARHLLLSGQKYQIAVVAQDSSYFFMPNWAPNLLETRPTILHRRSMTPNLARVVRRCRWWWCGTNCAGGTAIRCLRILRFRPVGPMAGMGMRSWSTGWSTNTSFKPGVCSNMSTKFTMNHHQLNS